MTKSISSGDYDVIESNVVYLYKPDANLILDCEFGSFKFKIDIFFVNDNEAEKSAVFSKVEGDVIKFKCINFNNCMGTGTVKPIEIATVDDKKLYIHFWSYLVGDKEADLVARKVEYTVFVER